MATLYVLSGAPGSGKSTAAQKLLQDFSNSNESALILSSDDIRMEVTGHYADFTKQGEKLVWDTLLSRAKNASQHFDHVIIDSTALTNKKRMFYWNNLHKSYDRFYLIIFDVPADQCVLNDQKRDRHVPEKDIRFMSSILQEPNEEVHSKFHIIHKRFKQ